MVLWLQAKKYRITRMTTTVTLLVPAALRAQGDVVGALTVEAPTVRAALALAGEQNVALLPHILTRDGQLRPFVRIFVRENDIRDLDGLDTVLNDGETVAIVPSVAGG